MFRNKIYILIKNNLGLILSVAVLAYYLFLVTYGFDVTDTGYHLAKQSSLINGSCDRQFDFFLGTNILGALWLKIIGYPYLIWARLGFVIVQYSIIFVSYQILVIYFRRIQLLVAYSFIFLAMSFWQHYFTINYDNLPLLMLLLAALFLHKGISCETNKKRLYYLISGIFVFISILCKITYIPSLLLPCFLCKSKDSKKVLNKYYFTGFTASAVIFVLVSLPFGFIGFYGDNILWTINDLFKVENLNTASSMTKIHSFQSLMWIYRNQIIDLTISFIKITLTILLFSLIYEKLKERQVIKHFLLIIIAWILYHAVFEPAPGIGMISLSFSLFFYWVVSANKDQLTKYGNVVFTVFYIFFLSFIGSNLGIYTGIRSGSLVFLLVCMLLLIGNTIYFTDENKIQLSFNYLLPMFIILFTVFYIFDDFRPYQDQDYKNLTTSFKTHQLCGIKSTKRRVEVVDSLMVYLEGIPDLKNKNVFFSKHSPMYYYLTGTQYKLKSPWDILNPLEEIQTEFEINPPEFFILPKGSHRNFKWPEEEESWKDQEPEKKAKRYYDYYESFLKQNNYIEVYKNSFYTVYRLKLKDSSDNDER